MSSGAGQGRIRGFIEAVTDGGIAGWAFREGDEAPLVLRLSVDGLPCADITCDAERPDVWAARADVREASGHGARLGFRAALPPSCFDGMEHRFDLLVETGESAGLATIGRPAGWIRQFSFPRIAVLGRVEPVENGALIFGWVVVVDRLEGRKRTANEVDVHSSNGTRVALTAGMRRPDVAAALGCGEDCGFRFVPPPTLSGPEGATLTFRVMPEDIDFAPHPIAIPPFVPVEPRIEPEPPPAAEPEIAATPEPLPEPAPEPELGPPPEPGPEEVPPEAAAEMPPEPDSSAAVPAADEMPDVAADIIAGTSLEDTEAAAALQADPDDPRLQFTGLPRRALFGIAAELAEKRAAVAPKPIKIPEGYYGTAVEQTVAEALDRAFYLATYRDVAEAGFDPVTHYLSAGWREGRMPAPWFDTNHYLNANPDVRDAGVNPFWHYLLSGRTEGRLPSRPGGFRRDAIESAVAPELRTADWVRPTAVLKLLNDHLERRLRITIAAAKGIVISVSHDHYLTSTGGVQLFIGDEQAAFARKGLAYLNLSPTEPDLVFAGDGCTGMMRLALDGESIGNASYEDLAAIFAGLQTRPGETRIFAVHCLLGHHLARLTALHAAFAPQANFFWLHDYSALCPGFNLLRNDVAFCGAPEESSDACLVCVYGERRAAHLAQLDAMFSAIPFTVVAPSQPALDIWQRASRLPHDRALVHPHCVLEQVSTRSRTLPAQAFGRGQNKVRIAFTGYPVNHKGWPIFLDLVRRTSHLGCYQFFHFVNPDATVPALTTVQRVDVKVAADHRDAMAAALIAHEIDIVLILAAWPETFSYVTYEALAAHADIITLPDSGNVAAVVLKEGRGIVAEEAAIMDLFESLRLVEYVRLRSAQGIPGGKLVHTGTTATLLDAEMAA